MSMFVLYFFFNRYSFETFAKRRSSVKIAINTAPLAHLQRKYSILIAICLAREERLAVDRLKNEKHSDISPLKRVLERQKTGIFRRIANNSHPNRVAHFSLTCLFSLFWSSHRDFATYQAPRRCNEILPNNTQNSGKEKGNNRRRRWSATQMGKKTTRFPRSQRQSYTILTQMWNEQEWKTVSGNSLAFDVRLCVRVSVCVWDRIRI